MPVKKTKSTRGKRNIKWCQDNLHLPEGKYVGQKLKMATFMQDDFKAIYDNKAGTRRAIITRGRKNAKSTETAFIILLHLCGPEHRRNSQLFSCAQSRDQAAVVFQLAANMVRMSPEAAVLRDHQGYGEGVGLRRAGHQIQGAFWRGVHGFGVVGQVCGPRSTSSR